MRVPNMELISDKICERTHMAVNVKYSRLSHKLHRHM